MLVRSHVQVLEGHPSGQLQQLLDVAPRTFHQCILLSIAGKKNA